MPALPPVTNVLRVTHHFTVGVDQTTSSSIHVRFTGTAPTAAQLNTYAGNVHQGYINGPILSTCAATILNSTTVTDLTSPSAAFGQHTGPAPGTAGGIEPPAQVAVLVSWLINRRYRGGKPRQYLPMGQMSDMVDAQHWSTAALANFRTHIATWTTALATTPWAGGTIAAWCGVSYYEGAEWSQNPITGAWKRHAKLRAGGPVVDDFIDFKVSSLTGTQRRRVRGRLT